MVYTYSIQRNIRPSDVYERPHVVEECLIRASAVAVFGGFRPPKSGENFVSPAGMRILATDDYPQNHPRVIMKDRAYQTETPTDFWE